jgi:hypothetical protein
VTENPASDTLALFSGMDGLQEVFCEECGESLGAQAAGTLIQREMWRHNQCPERIARQLGMTRGAYNTAVTIATATINGAYPDFPNNVLGDQQAAVRLLRAGMAARAVLESLSTIGFTLRAP